MNNRGKLKVSGRLMKKRTRKKNTFSAKKHCKFCSSAQELSFLDYKNSPLLKGFITERGKILPARISGVCAKHQRILSCSIKNSRIMALLPYTAEQV